MMVFRPLLLLLFMVVLLPGQAQEPPVRTWEENFATIQPKMTATEVRNLLGPPSEIVRVILFRKHTEQWIWRDYPGYRVEFLCVTGTEAVVLRPLILRK